MRRIRRCCRRSGDSLFSISHSSNRSRRIQRCQKADVADASLALVQPIGLAPCGSLTAPAPPSGLHGDDGQIGHGNTEPSADLPSYRRLVSARRRILED